MIVRWQAARLDRDLAAGVSTGTSAAHALRAVRITARRRPASPAGGLARVLRGASDSRPRLTGAVVPDPRAMLAARPITVAVERRLRGAEPVAVRGVAMLGELLSVPTSAVYRSDDPRDLASGLRAAAAALELGVRWE